jgi:hypothetical protein
LKNLFIAAIALLALLPSQLSCRAEDVAPTAVRTAHGRAVTRAEVWAALQNASEKGHLSGDVPAAAELRFAAPQTQSAGDANLQLRSTSYDTYLQQRRWVLYAPAEPQLLPFLVTAPEARGTASLDSPTAGRPNSPPKRIPDADLLVRFGETAHLQVLKSDMHMSLQVRVLEPGALHQMVRVQVTGSSHVLHGEVIGRDEIEARF